MAYESCMRLTVERKLNSGFAFCRIRALMKKNAELESRLLEAETEVATCFREHRCDFWTSISAISQYFLHQL